MHQTVEVMLEDCRLTVKSYVAYRTPRIVITQLLLTAYLSSDFFFFQAEDGIRDDLVTGVQTCALPIWISGQQLLGPRVVADPVQDHQLGGGRRPPVTGGGLVGMRIGVGIGDDAGHRDRSEERRVGKECRSRWSPYH